MQIRRKSNQRITKVKLDKILSLLNKAEKMTPEEGTTIVSTTDDLTPYPTLGNLRFWIRDYLLKGLSGIKLKEFKATQSLTVRRLKTGEAFYNIMIDGLILKSNLYKHISLDESNAVLKDVQIPKPGLQLSNLMKWYEYYNEPSDKNLNSRIKYKWFREKSSSESSTGAIGSTYFIPLKGDSVDTFFTTMFSWENQTVSGLQSFNYFWGWQPNSSYYCENPIAFKNSPAGVNIPESTDTSRDAWKWIYNNYNNNNTFTNIFIIPQLEILTTTVYDETGTNSTSFSSSNLYSIEGNRQLPYQKLYTYNTTYFTKCYNQFSINRVGIPKIVNGVLKPGRMNS